VKGVAPDDVLYSAGLVDTGEADEFYEAEVSGAELADGWYVVLAGDPELFEAEDLKDWSIGGRLVAVVSHPEAGFSLATEWRDGEPVWSISHEADEGEPVITIDGALPDVFEAVKREFLEGSDEQAFEAPQELASRLVGFHADRVGFEEGGPVFIRLEDG
jgi:hypothetical protein